MLSGFLPTNQLIHRRDRYGKSDRVVGSDTENFDGLPAIKLRKLSPLLPGADVGVL